ncbi:MAG: hypothetical protein J6P93_00655 [Alphaproteobacteria bacterium]|nr:hypothetical protein [Alphaproteobacteria bacterium]
MSQLQKILAYIIYVLFLFAVFYLIFFIWWLFLPVFIVMFLLGAWHMYRVRKMWNDILKQAQAGQKVHKHYRKVTDDNIIDVDYEEIRS